MIAARPRTLKSARANADEGPRMRIESLSLRRRSPRGRLPDPTGSLPTEMGR